MLRRLVVAGLFVLAVACSGGSSGVGGGAGGGSGVGGGSGGSGLTADEACDHLSIAICAKTDSCTPFATLIYYGDASKCAARAKLTCVPALGLSTTGATPEKIDACAKAIDALSCADAAPGYSISQCVFMGKLGVGIACGSNSQCATGYCHFTTANCGVCAAKNAAGGSCSVPDDCVPGATCAGGTCATAGGAGASCSATKPCKVGNWCKAGSCTVSGKAANTPCDSNDVYSCDFLAGYFCNQNDACVKIAVNNTGASCGLDGINYAECSGGGSCDTSGGTIGTCRDPVPDGQACDASKGLNCLGSSYCEGGVCKLANPTTCK